MFEWQYQNDQKHVHPKISRRKKHCIRPLWMLVTVVRGPNKREILAREYRIRLRGIDAPENKQRFGKEAKKELTKLVEGNCVSVHVYGEDKYGRLVGDVYCDGKFAQEVMLKKGLAWHYAAFDKRPELKRWAKEAKAAGIGLWADSDPWDWRKNNSRDGK
ncbi:hypothetical protein MKX03_027983 [Papaver bracteatum]|nr:hypothetical protein MKX03_027983 [Papaver bracteatum]